MKNALVYLLFVATLLPAVSQWETIAYYQVNKAYIARVLCVNRGKPQLHCDGNCYLAKKLKATQDRRDKETTERVQNTPTLSLFCQDLTQFSFLPAVYSLVPDTALTDVRFAPSPALAGLFRPPRLYVDFLGNTPVPPALSLVETGYLRD